jgi:hypothetical protein
MSASAFPSILVTVPATALCILSLLILGLAAPAQAQRWRLCLPDSVIPPLTYNDPQRLGSAERLLIDAGREAGVEIEFLYAPPARCLALMERGEVEAGLAAYTQRNRRVLRFPMQGPQVDVRRSLFRTSFLLLKRSDSALRWDGKALSGAAEATRAIVGTRRSSSAIIEHMRARGMQVDDSALSQRQLLDMLLLHRFELAAVMDHELRQQFPQGLPPELVLLTPPLLDTAIYAVPGTRTWAQQPRQVQAWWDAIGRLREQPAYRAD